MLDINQLQQDSNDYQAKLVTYKATLQQAKDIVIKACKKWSDVEAIEGKLDQARESLGSIQSEVCLLLRAEGFPISALVEFSALGADFKLMVAKGLYNDKQFQLCYAHSDTLSESELKEQKSLMDRVENFQTRLIERDRMLTQQTTDVKAHEDYEENWLNYVAADATYAKENPFQEYTERSLAKCRLLWKEQEAGDRSNKDKAKAMFKRIEVLADNVTDPTVIEMSNDHYTMVAKLLASVLDVVKIYTTK